MNAPALRIAAPQAADDQNLPVALLILVFPVSAVVWLQFVLAVRTGNLLHPRDYKRPSPFSKTAYCAIVTTDTLIALREFLVGAKSNDLWGFFLAQICCHWPLYPATFGQANPVALGRRMAVHTAGIKNSHFLWNNFFVYRFYFTSFGLYQILQFFCQLTIGISL